MNAHRPKITAANPLGGNLAGTVKSMSPAVPATFSPCAECEGTGFFVSGEFHPDDPRSSATWDCSACEGTGELGSELACQCGEPLDADLWCASCEALHRYEPGIGLVDVEMWREDNGRFGVGA